jgi:hypothetical protein
MKPSPNRIRQNGSQNPAPKQAPRNGVVFAATAPKSPEKPRNPVHLTENNVMDIEMAVDRACALLDLLGEEVSFQKELDDETDGESLGRGTILMVWDAQFALRNIVKTVKSKVTA